MNNAPTNSAHEGSEEKLVQSVLETFRQARDQQETSTEDVVTEGVENLLNESPEKAKKLLRNLILEKLK